MTSSYTLFGDSSYNLYREIPVYGFLEDTLDTLDTLDALSTKQQQSFEPLFNNLFGETNKFTTEEEEFIRLCFKTDGPPLKRPEPEPLSPGEKERYKSLFSDVAGDESWFSLENEITGDTLKITFEGAIEDDNENEITSDDALDTTFESDDN